MVHEDGAQRVSSSDGSTTDRVAEAQAAAEKLRLERGEWDAGRALREQAVQRAAAIAERESSLRRDAARLESKVQRR